MGWSANGGEMHNVDRKDPASEFSGQARGTRASSLPRLITRNRGPLEAEGHHFGKIEANCSSAS